MGIVLIIVCSKFVEFVFKIVFSQFEGIVFKIDFSIWGRNELTVVFSNSLSITFFKVVTTSFSNLFIIGLSNFIDFIGFIIVFSIFWNSLFSVFFVNGFDFNHLISWSFTIGLAKNFLISHDFIMVFAGIFSTNGSVDVLSKFCLSIDVINGFSIICLTSGIDNFFSGNWISSDSENDLSKHSESDSTISSIFEVIIESYNGSVFILDIALSNSCLCFIDAFIAWSISACSEIINKASLWTNFLAFLILAALFLALVLLRFVIISWFILNFLFRVELTTLLRNFSISFIFSSSFSSISINSSYSSLLFSSSLFSIFILDLIDKPFIVLCLLNCCLLCSFNSSQKSFSSSISSSPSRLLLSLVI